jgi:FKBP-type peptidyl-prolyl cis-trans isomerase SlyD
MAIGEKGDVLVKPEDAYGEYNEEAQQTVPKEQFAGIELEIGQTLYGQGEDGGTVQVTVKEIADEEVTVDFNHPLAGKTLMFTVTVNNVREATADEILSGVPAENAPAEGESCGTGCGCH